MLESAFATGAEDGDRFGPLFSRDNLYGGVPVQ